MRGVDTFTESLFSMRKLMLVGDDFLRKTGLLIEWRILSF